VEAFAHRSALPAHWGKPPGSASARIASEFMQRFSAILYVLATAAQVDPDAAGLLAETRAQRHTGQSRIVAALQALGALDPGLDSSEAADMVYALLSPDVHRILTVERGWPAERYERWIAHSLATLLPPASCRQPGHTSPPGQAALGPQRPKTTADVTSQRRSERSQ
jgi:hypothetical protein